MWVRLAAQPTRVGYFLSVRQAKRNAEVTWTAPPSSPSTPSALPQRYLPPLKGEVQSIANSFCSGPP